MTIYYTKNNVKILLHVVSDQYGCDSSLCENGGSCLGASYRYLCICAKGFTGVNCSEGEVFLFSFSKFFKAYLFNKAFPP